MTNDKQTQGHGSGELDPAWAIETRSIRVGQLPTEQGSHGEPIFTTSSFVFRSAEEAAARFAGTEPGNIYSRFTNPTVAAFEARLAAMEGGERAVAFASGMAAITAVMMALLKTGDHIVSSRSVFGTTNVVFEKYLRKFGVDVTWVDLTDMTAWQAAITPATRLLFLETPSNPLAHVGDLRALAKLARERGVLLVVDNCFCTPALQRPLELGADIVVHSATKYLDGQGRCLGGAVVGSKVLMEEVYGVLRSCGATLSPFNAWVFLKGLETLGLRMHAHCAAAQTLAEWLADQDKIRYVHYAGLPTHPSHSLAKAQQEGFGGVLSFELNVPESDARAAAFRFINATRLMSITANLGDAKTTITHPATTTHGRLSPEARVEAGITDGLVRLSIGLENVEDLRRDLSAALAAV